MNTAQAEKATPRWPLAGKTAADLMTPNPVSIHGGATVAEVVALLADAGFSAAPVIDDAGRPVGVISRTDVVVYDRARIAAAADVPGYYDQDDLAPAADGPTPAVRGGPRRHPGRRHQRPGLAAALLPVTGAGGRGRDDERSQPSSTDRTGSRESWFVTYSGTRSRVEGDGRSPAKKV
jgi:CBS domain-containing protein